LRYTLTSAPSASDPVVTTAEMRSFLRIDDSEEDTVIAALVASAVAALDGRDGLLGRALVTQSWTLKTAGPVDGIIRLVLGGVTAVNTVTTLISGSSTAWTGYRLNFDAIGAYVEPQDSESWPSYDVRDDAFSLTFTAGYGAASAVPETIKHAVKLLAAARYHQRESAKFPDGFMKMLAPFRHLSL
jgi:uncharacterized phiE125 gp8 family phage protein